MGCVEGETEAHGDGQKKTCFSYTVCTVAPEYCIYLRPVFIFPVIRWGD